MTCNPAPIADEMFDALKEGVDLPDLSGVVMPEFPATDLSVFMDTPSIKMEDLTEGQTGGSGVFDKLMSSVTAHLDRERTAGRITNNDFAKSYVDFSTGALAAAIQFLLQKDQAYWQALSAQTASKLALVQLATAHVGLEESKYRMRLMAHQSAAAEAQTALVKMQLATARIEFCTADLLPEQVRGAKAQADTGEYSLASLLPKQVDQLAEQIKVTKEQHETQRAQTLDVRSDNVTPVTGTLGKQKELHSQQIRSYQQDAQMKAARPFIDAWITMKTIDEGTLPPDNFNNANLNAILGIIRTDNDLT